MGHRIFVLGGAGNMGAELTRADCAPMSSPAGSVANCATITTIHR